MFLFPFFGAANLHIFFETSNKRLILGHENREGVRGLQDLAFRQRAVGIGIINITGAVRRKLIDVGLERTSPDVEVTDIDILHPGLLQQMIEILH